MSLPKLLATRLSVVWWAVLPVAAQTWVADNGNGTFTNPLFFDEFSDPDLIRVGSDFHLTGTRCTACLAFLCSTRATWSIGPFSATRSTNWISGLFSTGRREKRIRPGHLGVLSPVPQGHVLYLQQGQRTDHAVVPGHGPQRSLDEDTGERSLHDLSVLFDDGFMWSSATAASGLRNCLRILQTPFHFVEISRAVTRCSYGDRILFPASVRDGRV